MSRSYKKHPISKDGNRSSKKDKQIANRKIRRNYKNDLPTRGKGFRKFSDSYDINDYIEYWSKEEAIQDWNNEIKEAETRGIPLEKWGWHSRYASLEEFLDKAWAKSQKRK